MYRALLARSTSTSAPSLRGCRILSSASSQQLRGISTRFAKNSWLSLSTSRYVRQTDLATPLRGYRKKSSAGDNNDNDDNSTKKKDDAKVPPKASSDAPSDPVAGVVFNVDAKSGTILGGGGSDGKFSSPDFDVPKQAPAFVLNSRRPLLPTLVKTVDSGVFKELGMNLEQKRYIMVYMPKEQPPLGPPLRAETPVLTVADPAKIANLTGVLAVVQESTDGVSLQGVSRCVATNIASDGKTTMVTLEQLQDRDTDRSEGTELHELTMQLWALAKQLSRVATMAPLDPQLQSNPSAMSDILFDIYCNPVTDWHYVQDFIDTLSVPRRVKRVKELLTRQLDAFTRQQQASRAQEEKFMKQQQKMILMEQLKQVKGEPDEREALIAKFKERLTHLVVPKDALKVIEDEMHKLQTTETQSAEFGVIRSYLELLTQLPWGKFSPEKLDVGFATRVLHEDHYGLHDVKKRILEFISVGMLHGTTQGKILCFVGPPGVGKTSIGRSVARALGRPFYRFSVGGAYDVSEFKGHRRTYIGAMCGKIMQALKLTKVSNPVIMIDEVDKLGRGGFHGDVTSVLLEVLDPEQNNAFLDYYVDIPYDLSKVLFLCTANTLDTLPLPLIDRMEVIRVEGYAEEEKLQIAKNYLIPEVTKKVGLPEKIIQVTDKAIKLVISNYAREPGVRNLKKKIEKIFGQLAYHIVKQHTVAQGSKDGQPLPELLEAKVPASLKSRVLSTVAPAVTDATGTAPATPTTTTLGASGIALTSSIEVNDQDIPEYLGPWKETLFTTVYNPPPPGVAIGLAVSQVSSSLLPVEVVLDRSADPKDDKASSRLRITGSLGDVLKESADIAYTYAKNFLALRHPENRFFSKAALHMHLPEGATPKDGPSAGVTIVTALLSLAMGTPIRPLCAMTGEVNLHGYILPIGGVKEKLMAAKREGMQVVIFPKMNKRVYDELDDAIKAGIQTYFVNHYDEVYNIVFENGDGSVTPASRLHLQKMMPNTTVSSPSIGPTM